MGIRLKAVNSLRYFLPYSSMSFPANLSNWFDKPRALLMEIGSGSGEFLHAVASTGRFNVIGIEKSMKRVKEILHRLRNLPLKNVKVICAPGEFVLKQLLPDEVLDMVFVLFPDPWPKKAHVKRRLMSRKTLKLTSRKLKPSGTLTVITDHQGYRDWLIEQVPEKLFKLKYGLVTEEWDPIHSQLGIRFSTRYLRKWRSMNKDIFYITMVKRAVDHSPVSKHQLTVFKGGDGDLFVVRLRGDRDISGSLGKLQELRGKVYKVSNGTKTILKVFDVVVGEGEAWLELINVLADDLYELQQSFLAKVKVDGLELTLRSQPLGQFLVVDELSVLMKELVEDIRSRLGGDLRMTWSNVKGLKGAER